MKYNNVYIDGFHAELPDNVITSAEVEKQLQPVYEKLRLPEGRLEMFSGIKERRYWQEGTMPSTVSAQAGQAIRLLNMIQNCEKSISSSTALP